MHQNNHSKGQKSASSLTRKMTLYFSAIALLVGAILYLLSLSLLNWVEDELNRRTLVQMAPSAISAFQAGAQSPLAIGTTIQAFNDLKELPPSFEAAKKLPVGFIDEVHDVFTQDMFIYRTQYQQNNQLVPLVLMMNGEQVELSHGEWNNISLFIISVTLLLFVLFGFAITKVTRRLIAPINQLSKQLNQSQGHVTFSVSADATLEFSELARSLNHYEAQIQQLIRQEQAFSRYASHELRTPLTIIQGASRLLQHPKDEAFSTRQRKRIDKAASDMQHTINALLSLVKHEKGINGNTLRQLTAKEIEQVMADLQPLADTKALSIKLTMNASPQISPSSAVFRMLLINLLSNAINASDGGEILIHVNEDSLEVIDKGRGVAASEKTPSGHGLGLEIVEALCQRYQWRFSLVDAEKGCIATLHFNPLIIQPNR
ncbi:HAMP domain-containing histidine kinase [Shewanella mesophila]|nr:HAMP domain-containing histidine kinase [Shewanella mesophila]